MSRALAVVVTAAMVLAGVWVTGAVLTEDARLAMVLTAAWFGLAGVIAVLLARRRRSLAVSVIGAWLVTAVAAGGYLAWTSTVDRVVDEAVVTVPRTAAPSPDAPADGTDAATATPSTAPPAGSSAPVLVASGRFREAAHETVGRAELIETAKGRVLTLTGFETDPGPDLRVYLVRGDGSDVRGAVDLGALKGNRGNQQYDVPADSPRGSVVIWCRAFSVAFGAATLS